MKHPYESIGHNMGGDKIGERERDVPREGSTYACLTWHLAVSDSKAAWPAALTLDQSYNLDIHE